MQIFLARRGGLDILRSDGPRKINYYRLLELGVFERLGNEILIFHRYLFDYVLRSEFCREKI